MANDRDELMRLAAEYDGLAGAADMSGKTAERNAWRRAASDLRTLAQRAPQNGAVPEGWEIEVAGKHVRVTRPDGILSEWYSRPKNGSGMYDLCLALAAPAPEAERAEGDAEDTFREFVEMCAEQAGKMVNGNRLSMLAKKVLSSHPAPPPAGQPDGVEALASSWNREAAKAEEETVCIPVHEVSWAAVNATVRTFRRCADELRRLASAQRAAGSAQQGDKL